MKKSFLTKELKIVLGSLFLVLVVAFGIYYFSNKTTESASSNSAGLENLVRDFNHKMGPDNAKVKIVEFYDPECEACSAFFPFIKDVVKAYPNDVQLTVRYALYHGNSRLAAMASDAAALQGKFWEYQEMLFVNQPQWSHSDKPANEFFNLYAQNLNLDLEKFKADMNDPKRMDTISIDLSDGPRLGVNGTPTIFINGKMLEKLHPDSFREAVENELKK